MKKAILYLLLITVCFCSCKKDSHKPGNIPPVQTTYNVHFNLSGFTQQKIKPGSIKKEVNSLQVNSLPTDTNYLSLLYYLVYDSNGNFVHQIVQHSDSVGFGSINDNLPAGNYTAIFAGAMDGFMVSGATNLSSQVVSTLDFFDYPNGYWNDTFYNKTAFTVTTGGDVNEGVALSRIVGQLEIDVLNSIPANASKIELNITGDYGKYFYTLSDPFKHTHPTLRTVDTAITSASIGTTNFQLYHIMLNTTESFTVEISCYDNTNKVIGYALVNNVTCAINTRTILTGNLFGANDSFVISLNDTWNPVPHQTIHF